MQFIITHASAGTELVLSRSKAACFVHIFNYLSSIYLS